MYYSQTMAQSRSRSKPARLRRNRDFGGFKATSGMGPVTSTLFLVVIASVLALLYLTQITKTSVYGYQINELTSEQAALIEEQQELRVEAARLQSVARIERSEVTSGLEPETSVSYDNR